MPSKLPLVSVIVTTYNNMSTLGACLSSIRGQTYPHLEIIVVDNFSTDSTRSVARSFTPRLYIQGPERSSQRNFGVSKAKGKYVLIIDSDMELEPQVISQCVRIAKLTLAGGIIIPEKSFGLGYWSRVKAVERSWYLGDETVEAERFFSKKIFLAAGGYDTGITGPEDWDLPRRTRKLAPHSRIVACIRHNEGRQTLSRMLQKKYYYARKLDTYLSKNHQSPISSQQVYFFRPGVVKNIWKFWQEPLVYPGIWLMLILQTFAGLYGYIRGKL